ncbi:MAG: DUF2142 domain-containing protein [Chloroflexia bacterium]
MERTRGAKDALRRLARHPGLQLAVVSFWLGLLWTSADKPLDAPDEPSHLLAVMQVRVAHILPEVHYDFSQDPGGRIVNTPVDAATLAFATRYGHADNPYKMAPNESVQPPLYYLAAGLLSQVIPPDPQAVMYLSRLLGVLFGAGTVYFCWAATRQLAPAAPMWAIGAAGAVALLPQFCFNNASVSNDSLVNCLAAMAFYIWFRGLREPRYDPWMLRAGAVVGLAVLAKMSALVLLPGLALVLLFRSLPAGRVPFRADVWLRQGICLSGGAVAAALAVSGWWPVRNFFIYGDVTGLAGIVRYNRGKLQLLDLTMPSVQATFIRVTWDSFWGYFGWLTTQLPQELYNQAAVLSVVLGSLSLLCGLWRFAVRRRGRPVPVLAWQGMVVLLTVTLAVCAAHVEFSATVAFQPQGRYLFQALLPASLFLTGGLYALPRRSAHKALALGLLLVWLGLLNMVGLSLVMYRG